MNPFRQTIQDLALTHEAQGSGNENSWLFVLLSTMADADDANPATPTYPNNPIREVLHRLQAYGETFAGQRIDQILDKLQHRYHA